MAVIKPLSEGKLPCECGREGPGSAASRCPRAVWTLAALLLAVCCGFLVLVIRMTIQVHNLMEQVGNLSRTLQSPHGISAVGRHSSSVNVPFHSVLF